MAMLTLDWGDAASLVYVGIILLLCLVATPKKMRSRKLLVLALLAIVVAVATASFTAATGLLGITGLSLLVHEMVIRRKIVQAVLLGVVVLGTGYALTISDNPYSRQTMNRFTSLSETAMEGESLEDADDSGRWRAAMVSWRSFVSEPTFGIGAYYTMEYTDILGSHCSVLDWPAQYGLVGAFGPVLLFGIALVSSIKMGLRSLRPITARILALFWMVYLFNSLINPTWLESSIDFYAFFALGLTAALRYEHHQAGVLSQSRLQKSQPSTLTPSFAQPLIEQPASIQGTGRGSGVGPAKMALETTMGSVSYRGHSPDVAQGTTR
jgi:O-antigen ligase